MSTASTAQAAPSRPETAAAPVRHWMRLFRSELRIIFLRPRNLALLALLAAGPIFLGIVLKINMPPTGSGGDGPAVFLGQIAGNGVFLSLFTISVLLPVVVPLAVAVVSGDSIAGEAGLGTLRTLLTVPAGRTRLLVTKYLSIVVFCLAAYALITVIALAMGALLFPIGPVTLLSGNSVPLADGLARLALIVCYVVAGLAALAAIGVALSTFTQHAIAVMATVLVIVIVSQILDAVSQVAAIHPYLPTHYWFSFDAFLRMPIAWSNVQHGLTSFAICAAVALGVAWVRMLRANVTC